MGVSPIISKLHGLPPGLAATLSFCGTLGPPRGQQLELLQAAQELGAEESAHGAVGCLDSRGLRQRKPGNWAKSASAETSSQSCSTARDRKSTRLNSSHTVISYAVFCLKKKK